METVVKIPGLNPPVNQNLTRQAHFFLFVSVDSHTLSCFSLDCLSFTEYMTSSVANPLENLC